MAKADPAQESFESARAAYDRAHARHQDGCLEEAEALYRAALVSDKRHFGTLRDLGVLCAQSGRHAEAAELLAAALAEDALSAEAHNVLGLALQGLNRHDDALAHHQRAITLDPDYPEAQYDLGNALLTLRRYGEAIACYDAALTGDPDWPEAHFNRAVALDAAGWSAEAADAFRAALTRRPDYALAQEGLRALLMRQREAAPTSPAIRAQPVSANDPATERLWRYVEGFTRNASQPQMGFYPGLTAQPWHDPAHFPIVAALENAYGDIRREIRALDEASFHAESENVVRVGEWNVFLLYERGVRHVENCVRLPRVTDIVETHGTVRTLAGISYVSKMSAGTHIMPHRGPTNIRLRCHLGIKVPPGDCKIRVGGEARAWEEGKCIIFDDSFEHDAWNFTPDPRIVLIVDLWHPDLVPQEIAFLEGLHRYGLYQARSLAGYWAANEKSRGIAMKNYD